MLVEPAWYIRGEVYEARVRRYRSDDPFTGLFLTESTTNQQLVSLISPDVSSCVFSIPSRHGQPGDSRWNSTTSTGLM